MVHKASTEFLNGKLMSVAIENFPKIQAGIGEGHIISVLQLSKYNG